MTDNTKPEALDLADWLEAVGGGPSAKRCAALLREQHARIAELESELEAIGAGGVSGPLVGRAAPPTAQAEGWTKLPGQLPEPGMPVLLDIGKEYPLRAMWAAKHTVQAADDDTDWGEYVEEDDMYYAPEGWYEWNQCEDNHWRVTETPRAWMPLPPTSAERIAEAASKQEAQEPVAWLNPWRADQVTTDYDAYGERGIPLYTAPQPAPECHHRPPCAECASLTAQGNK